MDEHIYVTDGKIGTLKNAFYDDSLMTLTEWTQKHNNYATKEAIELLFTEFNLHENSEIVNSFLFFLLRYFIRGGFLDGKEGFLWHFLQGFWYRTLADAKVFEIKKRFKYNEEEIKKFLTENFL